MGVRRAQEKVNSLTDAYACLNQSNIPPEQKRAITHLLDLLPHRDKYLRTNLQLEDVLTTGNKFFTYESLFPPTLPRQESWQWNQSRSRNHFNFGLFLDISYFKLNTRKAKGFTNKSPPHKVWIFEILLSGVETINFFWCEKGAFLDPDADPQVEHQDHTETMLLDQYVESNFLGSSEDIPQGDQPLDPILDIEIKEITLEDLAFLCEFVEVATAKRFGWL